MKFLLLNGPNLNMLGRGRDPAHYGTQTLSQIEAAVRQRATELGAEVLTYQSNSEGALVDFLQAHAQESQGIIINPGALTHYGLSLRDALLDTRLPIVEVHLSNIHGREEWRTKSVIASIARAQVSGLGWRGYTAALEYLAATLHEEGKRVY